MVHDPVHRPTPADRLEPPRAFPPPGVPLGVPVPGIHRPYLLAMAVHGLLFGAMPFVERSLGMLVASAFVLLGFGILHLAWLWVVFRDARRALGEELLLDAPRVVAVSIMACLFAYVWTAVALLVLCRAAHRSAMNRDPIEAGEIGRVAADARGLLTAALVSTAVFLFYEYQEVSHRVLYRDIPDPAVAARDVIGLPGAVILALFGMALIGYYVRFVARAVPALYRSYRRPRAGAGA